MKTKAFSGKYSKINTAKILWNFERKENEIDDRFVSSVLKPKEELNTKGINGILFFDSFKPPPLA